MWELIVSTAPGLLLMALAVVLLTILNAILGIHSSPGTKSGKEAPREDEPKEDEPRKDEGPGFLMGRWTDKGDKR